MRIKRFRCKAKHWFVVWALFFLEFFRKNNWHGMVWYYHVESLKLYLGRCYCHNSIYIYIYIQWKTILLFLYDTWCELIQADNSFRMKCAVVFNCWFVDDSERSWSGGLIAECSVYNSYTQCLRLLFSLELYTLCFTVASPFFIGRCGPRVMNWV